MFDWEKADCGEGRKQNDNIKMHLQAVGCYYVNWIVSGSAFLKLVGRERFQKCDFLII
jgi:hypothetical protein